MQNKIFTTLKRIIANVSINTGAERNLRVFSDLVCQQENQVILNVGSGRRFLGYDSLDDQLKSKMINLDIDPNAGVDVVVDAHYLPFADGSVGGIISQAVLEHTRDSTQVVSEFERVTAGNSTLYAEIPFLQGYHAHPTDFRRFSIDGIRELFNDFRLISSGVCVGPSSALGWIFRQYLMGLLSGFSHVSPQTEKRLLILTSLLIFPLKYLDLWLADRPTAHTIAGGLYYLGQKTK